MLRASDRYLLRRLRQPEKWKKIFVERLTEPLHLNLLSAVVAVFGSFRAKVAFDLVVRQQYAFPILRAADLAAGYGFKRLSLIEFGVAAGAGLINMSTIAARVTRVTGVEIDVYGFDTGQGMPPPIDYRDLPECYTTGDFPMDFEALSRALPDRTKLVIGDIEETIPVFVETLPRDAPIGFVAIDVDYYSSAKKCLTLFDAPWDCFLPFVPVYLDDIGDEPASPYSGELLAVSEFNAAHPVRRIAPYTFLRGRRIFKNATWIDRMFAAHIHDHERRSAQQTAREQRVIANEFLAGRG